MQCPTYKLLLSYLPMLNLVSNHTNASGFPCQAQQLAGIETDQTACTSSHPQDFCMYTYMSAHHIYKIMIHNAGYSWVLATQNCGADIYLMRVLPQSHFPEEQLNRINKQPNKSYLTMSFPNNYATI